MLAGFIVLAMSLKNNGSFNKTLSLPPIEFGDETITNDMVVKFIEYLSIQPSDFRRAVDRTTLHFKQHTPTNPILRHPVIETSDESYVVPIPPLILDRCGEGIYKDFKQQLQDNDRETFLVELGNVFEKYIARIASESIFDWQLFTEIEYNGLKTCDLIIIDGDSINLIECKSSHMRPRVKSRMRENEYLTDLDKIIQGIKTILRTSNHLRNGILELDGVDISSITKWTGFIVTLDEYALFQRQVQVHFTDGSGSGTFNTKIFREYFLNRCQQKIALVNNPTDANSVSLNDLKDFPEANIQTVSIDDFEQILAIVHSSNHTLDEFATGMPINLQNVDTTHPLLLERYELSLKSISMSE